MPFRIFASLLVFILSARCAVLPRAGAGACGAYHLIDTRGSNEPQGPSRGFLAMNRVILNNNPGGLEYDTVYSANASQKPTDGTNDILVHISTTLASDPSICFAVEGWSQGAIAVVDAMNMINDTASFEAVKAVFLFGNPRHAPNVSCNTDTKGCSSTDAGTGSVFAKGPLQERWFNKTLDVCTEGDNICNFQGGALQPSPEHFTYPWDQAAQILGVSFITAMLTGSQFNLECGGYKTL